MTEQRITSATNNQSTGNTCDQLLLRPREAARMLAVSERTLWGADIPRIHIGKRGVRYAIDDLREWIKGKRS
jgi:predicted DNA-binding transcriptional regulator AlpA